MIRRALIKAIGPTLGVTLGGVVIPRLMYPHRYNDTFPPLLQHVGLWFAVGLATSFLVSLLIEWLKSRSTESH